MKNLIKQEKKYLLKRKLQSFFKNLESSLLERFLKKDYLYFQKKYFKILTNIL